MWPVDDPPKGRLHTSVVVKDVLTRFDGPQNVLVALYYAQQAARALAAADKKVSDD
jgi:hypothetical protein